MKLFADDTSLYCILDDQNKTAESLNSDLNSLSTSSPLPNAAPSHPTVLDLWDKLDNDTRNIQTLSSFRIKLNEDVDKSPSFYSIGSRSLNMWHCQLRNEASSLNHHLFQSHLSDSSQCACGDAIENNFPLFLCVSIVHKTQNTTF
jgi:hypothetical protein